MQNVARLMTKHPVFLDPPDMPLRHEWSDAVELLRERLAATCPDPDRAYALDTISRVAPLAAFTDPQTALGRAGVVVRHRIQSLVTDPCQPKGAMRYGLADLGIAFDRMTIGADTQVACIVARLTRMYHQLSDILNDSTSWLIHRSLARHASDGFALLVDRSGYSGQISLDLAEQLSSVKPRRLFIVETALRAVFDDVLSHNSFAKLARAWLEEHDLRRSLDWPGCAPEDRTARAIIVKLYDYVPTSVAQQVARGRKKMSQDGFGAWLAVDLFRHPTWLRRFQAVDALEADLCWLLEPRLPCSPALRGRRERVALQCPTHERNAA